MIVRDDLLRLLGLNSNQFLNSEGFSILDNVENSYYFSLIENTNWQLNFEVKDVANYTDFIANFYSNEDLIINGMSGSTYSLMYYNDFLGDINDDFQTPYGIEYSAITYDNGELIFRSGLTCGGLFVNTAFTNSITANTEYTIAFNVKQISTPLTFTNFGTLQPITISGTGIYQITLTGSSNVNSNKFILTQDISGSTDTIIDWIKVYEGSSKNISDDIYKRNEYIKFIDNIMFITFPNTITKRFVPGDLLLNIVLFNSTNRIEKNIGLGRVFKSLSKK